MQGDGMLGSASNIRVHSLASLVGQSRSAKMATVTFSTTPPFLLERRKAKMKQWSIPSVHDGNHGTVVVDVQATFHGFTFPQ